MKIFFSRLFLKIYDFPLQFFFDVSLADEANNLMDWKQLMNSQPQGHQEQNDAAPQPKQLLNFLVYISKEKNLAHVILATSDYFLASWLAGSRFHSFEFYFYITILVNLILICSFICSFCRGIGREQLWNRGLGGPD